MWQWHANNTRNTIMRFLSPWTFALQLFVYLGEYSRDGNGSCGVSSPSMARRKGLADTPDGNGPEWHALLVDGADSDIQVVARHGCMSLSHCNRSAPTPSVS